MQLRPDIALRSAIKSLTDAVLPALDSNNGPAIEQLQVTIGLLALVAERLPLEFEYDCDELARLTRFAGALTAEATDCADALADSVAKAEAVLAGAQTSPAEVLAAIRVLRERTGLVVSEAYASSNDDARRRISALVIAHADEQLTRERAWLLPQGWEPVPEKLPAIGDLLSR